MRTGQRARGGVAVRGAISRTPRPSSAARPKAPDELAVRRERGHDADDGEREPVAEAVADLQRRAVPAALLRSGQGQRRGAEPRVGGPDPEAREQPADHDHRDQRRPGADPDEHGADEERQRAEPDAAVVGQPLAEAALQLRARGPGDRADGRDAARDDRRDVAQRDERVRQVGVGGGEARAEHAARDDHGGQSPRRAQRALRQQRPQRGDGHDGGEHREHRARPRARRAAGRIASSATAARADQRMRPIGGSRAPVPGIGGRAQLRQEQQRRCGDERDDPDEDPVPAQPGRHGASRERPDQRRQHPRRGEQREDPRVERARGRPARRARRARRRSRRHRSPAARVRRSAPAS